MTVLRTIPIATFIVLIIVPFSYSAEPPKMRAGAYAIDVTPTKFPISVNGNMQDVQAKSAHDPLHARCLVLDDGTTKLAIVVVDSCMIPRELMDDAKARAGKATGIPTDRILISATHCHSAPTVAGVFQSDPDADYVRFLTEKIAEGIAQASKATVPAKVGWAVGRDPTQLFNRRWKMKPGSIAADPFGRTTDLVKMNPGYQAEGLIEQAGPIDPDVSILSVQTQDGKPLALLANYSLHYVGGVPALSADYFGVFAERIRTLIGADKSSPSFVGIMSNGTSGDVNNVNFSGKAPGKREPGEQVRVVAESVAGAAHEAYKGIRHRDDVTLAMAEKEIELGVRKPDEADLKRAKELLEKAPTPLKSMPEIYARETVLMSKYPDKVKLKLQAIRIGEVGIVAIPCEVFTEIGLELKKNSPLKPTFTIELANGYNGYLPTPQQHKLGGYETWRARSSYLDVEASPRIVDTVQTLLKQVAK